MGPVLHESTNDFQIGSWVVPDPKLPSGVRSLSLAAATWMSTSLAGADTPVGGWCACGRSASRSPGQPRGHPSGFPDSVHFGKCLDLVELQDGTIIMMVGAPDDDDRGRLWSQGNASGSVFVYRRDGATSQWVPFGPPNAPENKPVDFKLCSPPHNPASSLVGRSIWTWTKRAPAVRSSVLPVAPTRSTPMPMALAWRMPGQRTCTCSTTTDAGSSSSGSLCPWLTSSGRTMGQATSKRVPAPKFKFSHLGLARASSIRSIRSKCRPRHAE